MTYNARKKKNQRTLNTGQAIKRLFKGRKTKKCPYCGRTITLESASFDHVRALSKNGYDKTSNGEAVCRPCNFAKSNMSKGEFVQKLKDETFRTKHRLFGPTL